MSRRKINHHWPRKNASLNGGSLSFAKASRTIAKVCRGVAILF